MQNMSSVEDTLLSMKMEEGEITQEYGELELSNINKQNSPKKYGEIYMEVANNDHEELKDIHQYVMANLAVEPAPSHLLPPGWSNSSTSLLVPPPFLDFYFRLYSIYFDFFLTLNLLLLNFSFFLLLTYFCSR